MLELNRRNNKKHLVTSALPYVNNEPHLGNLLQVLSADVFARFSRLKGYDTLYICGTDEYGTASEMKALEAGDSEYRLCSEYHALHSRIYKWFNISFDIFSRTSEAVHTSFTQEIFKRAYRNGYIVKITEKQFYCKKCKKYISDRFVKGECPSCGSRTNSDQCDVCGTLIENDKLINPRCTICGSSLELRETDNLALDMPKLKDRLEQFVLLAEKEGRWPANAIGIAKSWLKEGLRERTITRDLKWGIRVPLRGFNDKVFYVWFDACIGYISLTALCTERWRDWWMKPDSTDLYQFIGKDNIPFHTLIFPATEFATGFPFVMLHRLNSSEYLTFEGGKFSKSSNIGVFGSDCMDFGYSCDIWRFYLYYNRPEKSDSDFSFEDFQEKVNGQLVGNFSNLVNRAFVFLRKQYDSVVPRFGVDEDFYDAVRKQIVKIDGLYEDVQIKDAFHEIFALSDMLNKYFQDNEPWKLLKSDPSKCGRVVRTIILGVKDLCILLYPYLPDASDKIAKAMSIQQSWDKLGEDISFDEAFLPLEHLFENFPDDAVKSAKIRFNSADMSESAKAQRELEAREAAERLAARKKAEREAAERAARIAAEREAREAAEKAAREAEAAARQKAIEERKAAEMAAREAEEEARRKAEEEREAAERAAREAEEEAKRKAEEEREAAERAAKIAAERAAERAAREAEEEARRKAAEEQEAAERAADEAAKRAAFLDKIRRGDEVVKDIRLEGESYAEAFKRRVCLKVSKIIEVKKHPEGDKLYILTLDTGEEESRTIVSSIVPFYSEDELLNHNVLLVANLKPAKFRGIKSCGMLLAASDKDDKDHSTCEVLFADDAKVGENVYPEGTVSESDYGTYIKPEQFFSIPFSSHNGVVEVDGAKLISEKTGIVIKCYKYGEGSIG